MESKEQNKKLIYIASGVALILAISSIFFFFLNDKNNKEKKESNKNHEQRKEVNEELMEATAFLTLVDSEKGRDSIVAITKNGGIISIFESYEYSENRSVETRFSYNGDNFLYIHVSVIEYGHDRYEDYERFGYIDLTLGNGNYHYEIIEGLNLLGIFSDIAVANNNIYFRAGVNSFNISEIKMNGYGIDREILRFNDERGSLIISDFDDENIVYEFRNQIKIFNVKTKEETIIAENATLVFSQNGKIVYREQLGPEEHRYDGKFIVYEYINGVKIAITPELEFGDAQEITLYKEGYLYTIDMDLYFFDGTNINKLYNFSELAQTIYDSLEKNEQEDWLILGKIYMVSENKITLSFPYDTSCLGGCEIYFYIDYDLNSGKASSSVNDSEPTRYIKYFLTV